MNERWKKIQDQAKEKWQQHTPTELQQKVQGWRENWAVAKLDFDDYTENLTKSRQEFAESRHYMLAHVGDVIRGRGGKTAAESDDRTAAWVENLGEHFHVVASQIASEDIHAHYRAKGLEQFIKEDADFRMTYLAAQKGTSPVQPPSEYDVQSIVYSFADPSKEWAVDPWIEEIVQPMTREEAVELYKKTVAEQIDEATKSRQPNVYEHGDPNTVLKAAAVGLGIAAIASAILGGKKRR